jgi:glyoxylase-like metal-dependent hydrolase (beta-lactamase superfamily II)
MKIANGVEMLEIASEVNGSSRIIYPTLIWDDENVILVDAAYPGQMPLLREAVQKAGVSFERLNQAILTHHDLDHIGSLASIRAALPGQVTVISHAVEKAYINGEKTPLKVAQMEANSDSLPDESKAFYKMFRQAFENSRVAVDQTCEDGDELPFNGGITIVYTPGHTLGHICLYLRQSKVLVAGDLLVVQENKLSTASPAINYDMEMYKKSLLKIQDFDIEQVICYHGGLYQDNPNQHIAALTCANPAA